MFIAFLLSALTGFLPALAAACRSPEPAGRGRNAPYRRRGRTTHTRLLSIAGRTKPIFRCCSKRACAWSASACGLRPGPAKIESLTLGVYAAREFETSDPDFADVLFDIDYLAARMP
jgi:hypothetical protein